MTLQHYLPATYLANFSKSIKDPRRESVIAVGDKRTGKCFTTQVSQVAAINDFYNVDGDDPEIIDRTLGGYEGGLDLAITQLIDNTISAQSWAGILVPFAADLMVRPPNFNDRFESRIDDLKLTEEVEELGKSVNNINGARILERQRLFAHVATSDWDVVKIIGDRHMIISDAGFVLAHSLLRDVNGIAIPLNSQFILIISPMLRRRVAVEYKGGWRPVIHYSKLGLNDHIQLNQLLAKYAQRFIFGEDEDSVGRYLFLEEKPPDLPEPGEIGFMDGMPALLNEMEWFKLRATLSQPPKSKGAWVTMDLMKQLGRDQLF